MRINIVHALPRTSSAYGQDHDGFSAAMAIIAEEHDVSWVNVHPANSDSRDQARLILHADFVLVRSDWGWYPDRQAARTLAFKGIPSGLVIAGSHPPPSLRQSKRYDVVFYETPWYAQFVRKHPFAVEAFGIDTRAMYNRQGDRPIDWLFVGRLADFKRPLRLLEKTGSKMVVGDLANAPQATREALLASDAVLVDHVPQEELGALYNRSKSLLVPCELQGGGERAVLEGRACGCEVEVSEDNPKLKTLLEGDVPSHEEYARALISSIQAVVSGRRTSSLDKALGTVEGEAAVVATKLRRLPSTVRTRWRHGTLPFIGALPRGVDGRDGT